jgi:ABC-type antimicrobial peptide transport system permease subunit
VVALVEEVKLRGLVEGVGDVGAYYVPQAQAPEPRLTIAARLAGDPSMIVNRVRREIARLDRDVALFDVRTMKQREDRSLVSRQSSVAVSIVFGVMAMCLAALGIYAVLAFLVSQRQKEIGIRIAIGGTRSSVFSLVVREGMLLVGIGVALGVAGALGLARILENQLFGVGSADPAVFSSAILMLAAVGFAACAMPAFRATRIDPVAALAE